MSSVSVHDGGGLSRAAEAGGPELRLRVINADEFFQMIRGGIIGEHERVELLDGAIIEMAPAEGPHTGAVYRLTEMLRSGSGYGLAVQLTLTLGPRSVVDPDVMLLSPSATPSAGITPADVLLAIEVSGASLQHDRGPKARRYAAAGIADYWVVDLVNRCVIVYRDPRPEGYGAMQTLEPGATVTALNLPQVSIAVAGVFE